ncbi:MAG: chorismate mutase [Chloroflexi bacterium]|nr:chorismate mutase [Chloroflexota bacterium]
MTAVRGVRGASTVPENSRDAIMDATEELLNEMVFANEIDSEDIAAVYFTLTSDLNAEFPAVAARERLGWRLVPLINSIEIDRPGSMPKCVRVLLYLNTDKSQEEIQHIYLRDAVVLRADITDAQ